MQLFLSPYNMCRCRCVLTLQTDNILSPFCFRLGQMWTTKERENKRNLWSSDISWNGRAWELPAPHSEMITMALTAIITIATEIQNYLMSILLMSLHGPHLHSDVHPCPTKLAGHILWLNGDVHSHQRLTSVHPKLLLDHSLFLMYDSSDWSSSYCTFSHHSTTSHFFCICGAKLEFCRTQ